MHVQVTAGAVMGHVSTSACNHGNHVVSVTTQPGLWTGGLWVIGFKVKLVAYPALGGACSSSCRSHVGPGGP